MIGVYAGAAKPKTLLLQLEFGAYISINQDEKYSATPEVKVIRPFLLKDEVILRRKKSGRRKMIDRNKFSPMIMVRGMFLLNDIGPYAGGSFEVKRIFQIRIGKIAM